MNIIDSIRMEDAYHPLNSEDFIDLTISHNGRFYTGLLEVKK